MALLGVQLVITLVIVSLIQKINPHFSFARWVLCSTGLIRYLYPTNAELKSLANIPKEKPRKGKHMENGKSHETFHVPRNLDITLENAQVSKLDIVHLKYFSDFQWLLDFAIYASITYALTEIYYYFYSIEGEINLSMLWCVLVIGFSFKTLIVLWVQYFKGDENVGERSTCIVMGFVYLLIAMAVLIVDDKILEIGLDKAYTSFNQSATKFLGEQGLSSTGPASKIVLKFFLAVWCGLLGSLLTFPGLRMAQMHKDALRYYKDRYILLLLANISFASPLLLVCLWIKPISRDYLTVRVFTGTSGPLMTSDAFDSMRLIAIIVVVLLKLSFMPMYFQSYLNLAEQRLEKQKKESGRITNVDLQKKIAAVFYYLCVVTIQFVAPLLMCLFFSFMYKTLGGYSWNGFSNVSNECSIDESHSAVIDDKITESSEKTITQTAEEFHLALGSLKQIFTTEVFRGLFGLATWWTCFTIFATNALGMFCQSYLTAA
ncbi:transmembrane protein 161B [Microplitis demolitor]|uniref:transmembrane protein 161B n=1 Tax=Microplitis demolitor TaxID=69319 RepID=UPI0004CCD156|nr:transmembrane protein 161B [Microplitis demolitor]